MAQHSMVASCHNAAAAAAASRQMHNSSAPARIERRRRPWRPTDRGLRKHDSLLSVSVCGAPVSLRPRCPITHSVTSSSLSPANEWRARPADLLRARNRCGELFRESHSDPPRPCGTALALACRAASKERRQMDPRSARPVLFILRCYSRPEFAAPPNPSGESVSSQRVRMSFESAPRRHSPAEEGRRTEEICDSPSCLPIIFAQQEKGDN